MKLDAFLPSDDPASWASWTLPSTHEHFSVSQLNLFLKCERAYQQQYILGRKPAQSSYFTFGSAVHNSIEWCLAPKIHSDEAMPAEDSAAHFAEMAWPNEVEASGGLGEISWEKDDTPEGLRLKGAQMVALYVEKVVPRIEPRELETEFMLDIEGIPIPIKGRIDITQKGTRPSIDLKTQARAQNSVLPNWLLQGRTYQLVEERAVDWHVLTKQTNPQVITSVESPALLQSFSVEAQERTRQLIRRIAWRINYLYSIYGADETWDWTGITRMNACGYCAYRHDCPGWEGA